MDFESALPRLVTLFDQGRLAPFVGLGMSLPTCSTWRQNIDLLAAQARDMDLGMFPNMKRVGRDALPRWAHRIVALLKRAAGDEFPEVMRDALYLKAPSDPAFIPPQTRALAKLYWPLVLTTNYDDLLYRASHDVHRGWAVRGRSWHDCDLVVSSLTGPAPRTLWALQGFLPAPEGPFLKGFPDATAAAIAAELAAQMVVGHEEYRRVTYREPWFRRAFAEVFRSRSFLFLGSGLAENYLLELFGEALEMTGMSPYPHFAFVQRGEVDPDFLRSRLNILVIEYQRGKHEQITERLNALDEAVSTQRLKPATVGFSFRLQALLGATPDVSDLLLVRGTLPKPEDGECVGISCGRGTSVDGQVFPLVGGDPTHGVFKYLIDNGLNPGAFRWIDRKKTLCVFRRTEQADPNSPYYGLVARTTSAENPDVNDLRIIPSVCKRFFSAVRDRGFKTARLMIIAGGPHAPFPPLHAGIQMARGIRSWFREQAQANLRVVVHLVDPSVWFNIESGRLNLHELLANDSFQVVVLVQNPDGTASRQYRLIREADTVITLAATVHVPLSGWEAEIQPSPIRGAFAFPLSSDAARSRLFDLGLVPGSTVRFAVAAQAAPGPP
jgi:hypothetical protein